MSYKLIPLCNQYTIDNILHLHHKHDHDKQPFDLKKAAKDAKAEMEEIVKSLKVRDLKLRLEENKVDFWIQTFVYGGFIHTLLYHFMFSTGIL